MTEKCCPTPVPPHPGPSPPPSADRPPQNSNLVAVYKKYSSEKLQRIATTFEAPADSALLGYGFPQ